MTTTPDVLPTNPALDLDSANRLAEMFKALSDPSRVRILAVLENEELSVGVIAAKVELSESAVSHQLRGLRQMRLVRARRDGRLIYYTLDDEHIKHLYQLGLEHITHR